MPPRLAVALTLALAPLAARAAEEPKKSEEKELPRLVVIQDDTQLLYGQEKIGQLAEGTVVGLIETKAEWAKVRVPFAQTCWVEGWLRFALTVPDTLRDVQVTLSAPKRAYTYENLVLPGMQFLEVKVKFEATERSPSRVYFRWDDEAKADIALSYGRDKRIAPYGFMRQKPLSARHVFERVEKRQTLILSKDAPLVETYVFAVPVRARDFDLILKDLVQPVRER
jgi:hypothetical protein